MVPIAAFTYIEETAAENKTEEAGERCETEV